VIVDLAGLVIEWHPARTLATKSAPSFCDHSCHSDGSARCRRVVPRGISAGACNGTIYVQHNLTSFGPGIGIQAAVLGTSLDQPCRIPGSIVVTDNVSNDNGASGFNIVGAENIEFKRNVAARNLVGVSVIGGGVLVNSAFIGNRQFGVVLGDGGPTVIGSSIIGNGGPGITLTQFATKPIAVHRNNIFGNAVADPSTLNCGIFNSTATAIHAQHNYWGASTGPGAEPADNGCSIGGGVITVTPFATERFPVNP
jgi:hypothetical protein